jgi:hypothetical protein
MTEPPQATYCYNHPNTETSLRCNNCEQPICVQCAVLTPTGYRCKECIRNQQKKFETAEWYDYVVAFVAGSFVAFISSLLIQFLIGLSWFIFLIIFITVGAFVGVVIAEIIRYVTRRRRSKRLFQLAAASVVVGFLPLLLLNIISLNFWNILWIGIMAFSTASGVYARLRGLRL